MWLFQQRKRQPQAYAKTAGACLAVEALEDRNLLSLVISDQFSSISSVYADLMTGDFNGDGRADLVDIRDDNGAMVLDVRLGNGDGTFGPALTSPTGFTKPLISFPLQNLETADFNNDGRLDVAAFDSATSRLEVFLAMGDGRFHPPFALPLPLMMGEQQTGGSIIFETDSLAVGDLNEDGWLDLVVVADLSSTFTTYLNVLLGQGDGSFAAQTPVVLTGTHHTSYAPAANISVGDYTGDGHVDVLSVSRLGTKSTTSTELFLHPGRGDGTFESALIQSHYSGYLVVDTMPADLNGDGNLDFVATVQNAYPVLVGLGNGDGTFGPPSSISGSAQIVDVAIADLNADGIPDMITAESTADVDHVGVLLGNGDGSFQPVRLEAYGISYHGVVTADFNDDGRIDVAANTRAAINDGIWDGSPPPPPPPYLTIGDVTVTEGDTGSTTASFTVNLSKATTDTITVHYATADSTGLAGSDYQASSGTLTFSPSETSKTITVLVQGDRLGEPKETFFVNLSGATNAIIVDSQAMGTIQDNEPRISISDFTRAEGKKGQTILFTFTVTLSDAYDRTVTVSYRTVDGTAKTSGDDFVGQTGSLTFVAGETTKTITIEVYGDNRKETDETFFVDLFGKSSNSLFSKKRGIGTILNDD